MSVARQEPGEHRLEAGEDLVDDRSACRCRRRSLTSPSGSVGQQLGVALVLALVERRCLVTLARRDRPTGLRPVPRPRRAGNLPEAGLDLRCEQRPRRPRNTTIASSGTPSARHSALQLDARVVAGGHPHQRHEPAKAEQSRKPHDRLIRVCQRSRRAADGAVWRGSTSVVTDISAILQLQLRRRFAAMRERCSAARRSSRQLPTTLTPSTLCCALQADRQALDVGVGLAAVVARCRR